MMKLRSLLMAIALTGGLTAHFGAQAHPSISGHLQIGDGPVHLGINLGHWHGRHHWPSAHQHGAGCYRRFPQYHRHWEPPARHGHHTRHPYDHHPARPHRHGPAQRHHANRHGHPGAHYGHRPSHRPDKPRGGHRHSRDCYLHYPRGHEHWGRH